MASSSLFWNSINPSTSLFSRTHFQSVKFKHTQLKATALLSESCNGKPPLEEKKKKMKVLIAGGGIGGLVFAMAAKRKGFDVLVFERDLSAVRGEGQYRGPIQIQSNALAALEAIDVGVAEEVIEAGCITGNRINGLVDGISGTWYVKFDIFTPAVERGLPVTRVISRMTLQQILVNAVGQDAIMNKSNVINFEDKGDKVIVMLENGQLFEGDILVGADGIRSKVRKNLFGPTEPTYSGYTCYTGIADFVPLDSESVGYRVFLGHKQYFVSLDVGAGKMQWYAFHYEAPGGIDSPNCKKERLLKIFEGWRDNVIDLIQATDEEAVLRRDIYDMVPTSTWGKGRLTLLGDSVHAVQPNLGQGGCMALEDGYQLAVELEKAWNKSIESGRPIDIISSLRSYERSRLVRVSIIHGIARMAANMALTYKPYLGIGLDPFSGASLFLAKFRIPHPGRVLVKFLMNYSMPSVLNWVVVGNSSKLQRRSLSCRLSDKASDKLWTWFEDDDALERSLHGEWFLLPCGNDVANTFGPIHLRRDENMPCVVGSVSNGDFPGMSIVLPSPEVSETHARITYKDGAFYIIDLKSKHGTFIADNDGRWYRVPPNYPTRFHPSYAISFGFDKKVKFRVKVMRSPSNTLQKDGSKILQAA